MSLNCWATLSGTSSTIETGGNGGLYGAGGGGGGYNAVTQGVGGTGAQGICKVTYTAAGGAVQNRMLLLGVGGL
jgi:hypothetical protein